MNYDELAKPYDKNPGSQRRWLVRKHGIPMGTADSVMAEVYAEIAAGETYETGAALDRELLRRCEAKEQESFTDAVRIAEKSVETALQHRMKADHVVPRRKRNQWSVGAFLLGLLAGAAAMYALIPCL